MNAIATTLVGQTLGHFRIDAKLGEGGMGVVYKARDTHLDRFVALKVLPPETIADPERRRRFIHEAKAASALNHPNIVTVHEVGREAGLDFIVMELVDGKTLDDVIGRQGLKLDAVLKYGVQIADALAAAHAAGIVHRDLKPANVIVTAGGLVKVLDFGLAKLTEPLFADGASTRSAQLRTEEGVILGTVGYMSPEQAHGKPADARSDIFSFGSVLYEMVTGRRAFQAETPLATLAAIADKEPVSASTIAADTPPDLEKLIARCLRKDPERRMQHMGDVKLALLDVKEERDSGRLHVPLRGRSRPLQVSVAALLLVGLALAAGLWRQSHAVSGSPVRTLTRLTWDTGLSTDPALSPDGKLLAYASDRAGEGGLDIFVQQIGGGAPLRLTQDAADERAPAFSPDGTTIVFRSEKDEGGIYVVSALGGSPRLVARHAWEPRFSPDGKWIAYSASSRIYVVPASGGEPRRVRPEFWNASNPLWAPDSKHLLFPGQREAEGAWDWWVTTLDGPSVIRTGALEATRQAALGGPLQVTPQVVLPSAWQAAGNWIVFSARSGDTTNLWRVRISSETWTVTGAPERVTAGSTLEAQPTVAQADGAVRLAFASLDERIDLWSLTLQPNRGTVVGEPQRVTVDASSAFHPGLSPDGSRVVFVSDRSGQQEIWVKPLMGEAVPLTASRSRKWRPRFAPDGSRIAYDDDGDVYIMSATGGTPELVCRGCGQVTGWSSDGSRMLVNNLQGRVYQLDLASRRKTELLSRPGHFIADAFFSPDDRWIAFSDATPSWRTYVAPVVEGSIDFSKWVEVMSGHGGNVWSPDGTLIYNVSDRDGHKCIWAQRLDASTKRPVGASFEVFHHRHARVSVRAGTDDTFLAVGRDKMIFNMTEVTGNIWMTGWKER